MANSDSSGYESALDVYQLHLSAQTLEAFRNSVENNGQQTLVRLSVTCKYQKVTTIWRTGQQWPLQVRLEHFIRERIAANNLANRGRRRSVSPLRINGIRGFILHATVTDQNGEEEELMIEYVPAPELPPVVE